MKLPITDQFLWDLYTILDKTGDILKFITQRPTMYNYLPGPKNPIFNKYRKDKNKRKFGDLIYYLKTNDYIKVKVLKASFKIGGKIKRKDGKWVMLIFDLPQQHKKARGLLRSILHNLNYKMFQQSVWVTPYDVSDKTERLLQLYSLDQYVKIFLIEEL